MSAPMPIEIPQPLPINEDEHYWVRSFFFAPIRFCGRQWIWVESDDNNEILQVALKILSVPFLACTTLLSVLPAFIGGGLLSAENIQSITEHHPKGDISLLSRNIQNEEVAERIKDVLQRLGLEYVVEVRSMDRDKINEYYSEYIHRYVTLIDPSSTEITRIWQLVKNNFHSKESPSLSSLYPCICDIGTEEDIAQLRDVLSLYKSVTFSIAFDLAYVRTDIH